jgi:RNA polymerase sigma-70 factor (ECF subfamily)
MRAMRLFFHGALRARSEDASEARLRAAVEAHFDFIWRLLRRLGLRPADADDAAQQVFMIATQKLHAIAPGSERSFLYGAAVRVAANARRTAQRRLEQGAEALEQHVAPGLHPEQRHALDEAWTLLDELLERLPDELRRVLVLAEIEQLEVAEIAALEGIPSGTAASRLRRAREEFRDHLKRAGARNPFAKERA